MHGIQLASMGTTLLIVGRAQRAARHRGGLSQIERVPVVSGPRNFVYLFM